MISGTLRPPAGEPLLLPDGQVSIAWIEFFQDLADQIGLYASLARGPTYADDAAAAAGGVQVGDPYRTGTDVRVRII